MTSSDTYDSSEDDIDSGDEFSASGDDNFIDDESGDDSVWRDVDDTEILPILFNSTARRKKTIDNYTAPQHMRNTVYRCREFPNGVYINRYGEVCPDHELSSDRVTTLKRCRESPPHDDSDDSDAYTNPKRTCQHESSDSESSSDESSDAENSDESDISADSEESCTVQELQSVDDECAEAYVHTMKTKQQHTKSMKMMHTTQDMVAEWGRIRKVQGRSLHMEYDSYILVEEPGFEMVFSNLLEDGRVCQAYLDCGNMMIRCQCSHLSTSITECVVHIKQHHFPVLYHIDQIKLQWAEYNKKNKDNKKWKLSMEYESTSIVHLNFSAGASSSVAVLNDQGEVACKCGSVLPISSDLFTHMWQHTK